MKSFGDAATKDIFNGINSKRARKKLDFSLHTIAYRKLDMLNAAACLKDLLMPPSNRLELLKGRLKGNYSIRINDQYRIICAWGDYGPERVEIIDYH